MTISVIFLDYLRHEYSQRVKDRNFNNAGHPFELITIDKKGIAAAFNEGLRQATGDAAVFMANDILMPNNWLAEMVRYATGIPNTGLVGIYTVESLTPLQNHNGFNIHPVHTPFGNTLVPMDVVHKIGGYNEDFDPYGMQDADYGERVKLAGYISYYLPNMQAEHIGHDVGSQSEYRKMKDEGLKAGMEKWTRWTTYYNETGNLHLPLW